MTELIDKRVERAIDWVHMRKGDVVDVEDLVRGIVWSYARVDVDGPVMHPMKLVPLDDPHREASNSALPFEMISAGMDVLDQVRDDLKSDDLKRPDWDNGMIAVAVYRAMVDVVPAREAEGAVGDYLGKARARLKDNPQKFLRKDAARLLALVETQARIIDELTQGRE